MSKNISGNWVFNSLNCVPFYYIQWIFCIVIRVYHYYFFGYQHSLLPIIVFLPTCPPIYIYIYNQKFLEYYTDWDKTAAIYLLHIFTKYPKILQTVSTFCYLLPIFLLFSMTCYAVFLCSTFLSQICCNNYNCKCPGQF